ncbi:MAG TPA: type 1 glutamine amidotransferase [Thermoleophilaceae bacterium]
MRALILQHEQPTPGGYVNQWLEERGIDQDVFRIDIDSREVDARDYDLIVSLGSEFAAFDDLPWIRREEVILREAMEHDVPVLGVCFGGQLLAKVLGGNAFRSDLSEIGWLPVRTHDESLVPHGPWFQWHFDSFTLPDGAKLIAESDVGPQAFIIGRSLGTQFHPEVTPEIMESWVRAYPHELEQEGVDPQGLLDETYERAADTRATAWRLFDAFLTRVAGHAKETVRGG